ncbi:putative cleavage and polyadenylation specificity factor subunit 2 [Dictyocoela muelleri]|nr:putative cleavage and polyadenylation specificity factor subunit 2 [Dictyocoela muelleri]
MTCTKIKVTPLDNKKYSYLLEIDNTIIQINCRQGIKSKHNKDKEIDKKNLDNKEVDNKEVYNKNLDNKNSDNKNLDNKEVDCCLITHPSLEYIKDIYTLKSKRTIATLPTHILARIEFLEYNSRTKKYQVSEIEKIFSKIETIKHKQPIYVNSIKIVAYNSGYSMGGSVFHIKVGIEDIIVMMNVNHRKERHIDGLDMVVFQDVNNPFLVIVDSKYVLEPPINRKERDCKVLQFFDDEKNLNPKKYTLTNQVHKSKIFILISYTRLLELLFIISDLKDIKNKKIVLIGAYAKQYLGKIKSLLEWTGEFATNKFSETKINPLIFDVDVMDFFVELKEYDVYILTDIFSDYSKSLICDFRENCKIINFIEGLNPYFDLNDNDLNDNDLNDNDLNDNDLNDNDLNMNDLNDNDLIFISSLRSSKFVELKIPRIGLDEVEIKIDEKNKDEENILVENSQRKNEPELIWYEKSNSYFFCSVHNQNQKILFPDEKKLEIDDYGEYFEFKEPEIDNKIEIESIKIEKKKVETVNYQKYKVKFEIPIINVNFGGISDLLSLKMILDRIEIKKLLILEGLGCEFQASYCSGNVIRDEIEFKIPKIHYLEDIDFLNSCKFVNFKNLQVGAHNVKLTLSAPINSKLLKDKIDEKDLQVEIENLNNGDIEIRGCNLYSRISNNEILISGVINDAYIKLRDVFYDFFLFLE